MRARILLALSFAAVLALPAHAQFAITVQQNGQASGVNNGGAITLNAPGIGQTATATVTVTYLGNATASFASGGKIVGSSAFSASGDTPIILAPFQSTTFTVNYTPTGSTQAIGLFSWIFSEIANVTTSSGTTTPTTLETGTLTLSLIGNAPNLIVGDETVTGSFQAVANGGTIQFPNTTLNSVSTMTVAITNTGSGPGTVNSITVSGAGFQPGGVPLLPIVINAGSELNVTVQFQPASTGAATGSLQIAFANGTYMAVLSGTAVTSFLSYTVTQGGTTSPLSPGQTITLHGTNVGSTASAIVQFQNTGTTAFVLSSIALSGTGFSITDGPFLPVTIQPQQSNTITLTYTPTQGGINTGRLLIGGDIFLLSAQGLAPTLTYTYQAAGVTNSIVPGAAVSFSPVVDGQTTSVQFTVTNTGTTAATLASIGVVDPTGVFTVSNLPTLPLQLNPAANASFNVNYSPVGAGVSTATLAINTQAFALTGFPEMPPALPNFTFTGASGTQQPFQQPAIGLSVKAPYSYPLFGTLTLSVASGSFSADPAVQFSSGGSQVAFTIPANSLQALFPNGASQVQLQTGTVAGTIQITPAFMVGTATGTNITPSNPASLQITVPSQAPALLSASIGSQTTTSLSVAVTGFSTTRSLEHLSFQLTAASGYTLAGATFSVDVSSAATLWFQSSASQSTGGQFTVTIPFSFAEGSASSTTNLTNSISTISITATNATGTSNAVQIAVP